MAERERRVATLEEQVSKQGSSLQQSAATIESLTVGLERIWRDYRKTLEVVSQPLDRPGTPLPLQIPVLDQRWEERLDVIRQALERL